MRPGIGDRPATLPGLGNRPNTRPAPGGNRQEQIRNRVENRPARRDDLQARLDVSYRSRHVDRQHIDPDYGVRPGRGNGFWHGYYHGMHHGHWHHGCWGGNCWGNWWNHMWTYHPGAVAFGLTVWGVNRSCYWWGYSTYYNPYYVQPVVLSPTVTIDYSQPLTEYVQQTEEDPPSGTAEMNASTVFDRAREDFHAGEYESALERVNKALAVMPGDPVMNEFRSLVLFAQGDFKEAAANIHAVLAVGPGWDWTTLTSLYPSTSVYQQQLGKLEDYAAAHEGSAAEHFLLGYHYMTEGHTDAAAEQFHKVVAAEPQDVVARQMLEMVAGPQESAGEPTPPVTEDGPQIPAGDLVGTWSASGSNGDSFTLVMDKEGKFSWTYTGAGDTTSVEGVYAIDGITLAMEPDAGGVMVAEISPPEGGAFHFQVVGGPPGDGGLVFKQQ